MIIMVIPRRGPPLCCCCCWLNQVNNEINTLFLLCHVSFNQQCNTAVFYFVSLLCTLLWQQQQQQRQDFAREEELAASARRILDFTSFVGWYSLYSLWFNRSLLCLSTQKEHSTRDRLERDKRIILPLYCCCYGWVMFLPLARRTTTRRIRSLLPFSRGIEKSKARCHNIQLPETHVNGQIIEKKKNRDII